MVVKRLKQLKSSDLRDTLTKIDTYLEETVNAPVPYKQKPSHSPSIVGTKCFRKIYYSYWRTPKDKGVEARVARIFETGNIFEDMFVGWLKKIGEHVPYLDPETGKIPINVKTGLPDPQFPIYSTKYRINRGYIDNIALLDDKLWIYEIKTSNEKKWKALKEPEPNHITQASLYYTCFNELLAKGEYAHIPQLKNATSAVGVKYFYINKNTSEIKQFLLNSIDLVETVKKNDEKLAKANQYNDLKTLPPKTPDLCIFCNFWKKCKNDQNIVIENNDS
jgi:hypothetical protein